jgi:glycine betaine/proline transport system ATP-binding protein
MSTQAPLIEVRGLSKVFGSRPDTVLPLLEQGRTKDDILAETGHTVGLRDIDLSIERGETFVIMGLSGSGKSTLIRHFNRLIDPTVGQILVDGADVMQLGQRDLEVFRQNRMAMVFQRFALLPHATVLDNVAYGLRIKGMNKRERDERAAHWLERVGLAGYERQYPNQLSGGQQQRVGLARALATDAEILLMDEAFSALDPLIRSEMQDQLLQLQDELHKTIVFITHDLDEALRLGNHIAILRDGRLVQVGSPSDILMSPADDYVEAFVRDVNRSRVLSIETVMRPPSARITAATLDDALRQMRERPEAYAYWVDKEGFKGVLVSPEQGTAELVENATAYTLDTPVEQALPGSLQQETPLPVVDESGELKGELSREALAEMLTHSPTAAQAEAEAEAGQPRTETTKA